MAEITYTGCHK